MMREAGLLTAANLLRLNLNSKSNTVTLEQFAEFLAKS
jgi:hypothetical protein